MQRRDDRIRYLIAFIAVILETVAFALWRTRMNRWGATDEELGLRLPGDDLVAEPASQVTRAITIKASPEDVWPWILQIGADRGGFYSYDWLENLFGLGIHSAGAIESEWQRREAGDVMYANAKRTGGWYVMEVRPNEALVVEAADLKKRRTVRRNEPPAYWEFAWAFVLAGRDDGTTRLLVRERVAFGNRIAKALASPVGVVSFLMTRKMMLGIKARAEAHSRDQRAPVPASLSPARLRPQPENSKPTPINMQ